MKLRYKNLLPSKRQVTDSDLEDMQKCFFFQTPKIDSSDVAVLQHALKSLSKDDLSIRPYEIDELLTKLHYIDCDYEYQMHTLRNTLKWVKPYNLAVAISEVRNLWRRLIRFYHRSVRTNKFMAQWVGVKIARKVVKNMK